MGGEGSSNPTTQSIYFIHKNIQEFYVGSAI